MRIGILSDIHGNLRALKAIVKAFQVENVDNIICIGDMIGYYHQSLEVIDFLMGSEIQCILGNHEGIFLGINDYPKDKWNLYFFDQVKENISPQQKEWLSKLPKFLEINNKGKKIAFFHGSPWDPLNEYIYPNSDKFNKFGAFPWDYIFLGHTHYPMTKKVGKVNIVNPGSCGQPRDGDIRASAAIFDSENEQIIFVREAYDVKSTIEEARLAGVSSVVIKKLEFGEKDDKL